ncbi:MAG TPA: tRNA (adenosine(37)-N6)-dimethylallyltransferase MiaA, partial [Coriobacteriia bacterium]
GPTGVGKTEVAEQLASRAGGEVVSADSMQVYRGMDIGTAKRPAASRRVPYHCVDVADPGATYSAALYQADARRAMDDVLARGGVPVLAGGTGLYVRAAIDDWTFPPGEVASETRAKLESEAARVGAHAMHARLAAADPRSAALIHPNNLRRTLRALEMAEGGVSYAAQAGRFNDRTSVYDAFIVGLDMERAALYAAIDARVDAMMVAGLVDEVRGLLARGRRDALTATQAIGYKELVPVVEGGADLVAAVEDVKRATRRYAKRQLTWFRADPRVRWLDVTGLSCAEASEAVARLIESAEGTPAAS